ncbi:D-alanine--D-alanine ligase [Methylobacterium sp. 4-46]|uniref:D-alanine--D-alanine ligase n=1 Tax=Methylobacterium sp. (strain 4-46) TaxID=426117 RepID=DDL_METS4|nr:MULTISPECIES: D-alanine--D-alanine ligase family protein [Methylobacterium]B0UB90.1 RecName: Full=D-alanine--D-alanine ligase; AltName: Full=D-Ala-D-Ala ligase; AltName: Full=D-alanylalanine synthetase [Methylobacterium sp. 4-46]ACA15471.1 D-alanine--D-alanine ligase [Methylobacterium sp. 4-46]WFT81190.1 D-alanine--D-alanine ligase [Methylobacterium nodulans]
MRRNVALLFGGRSAEHEVSIVSAGNVARALDPDRYAVTPIAIDKETGAWRLCPPLAPGEAPAMVREGPRVAFLPGGGGRLAVLGETASVSEPFDVVVPVLHGPNGEDGTVQGALDLAGVPYVGSGVIGSAAAMDKDVAKRLMRDAGLPIVPYLVAGPRRGVAYTEAVEALESRTLFVKPANMGSSVGVSRVADAGQFDQALAHAFAYDEKILIERAVPRAREIEFAVLETAEGEVRVSPPGEIAPAAAHGFYGYDAKYVDPDGAALLIPASLAPALAERMGGLAARAFEALACAGLARVDLFLDPDDPEGIFVNEVNTLPGFTAISMYPKLWDAAGLAPPALMDALIAHALARHARAVATGRAAPRSAADAAWAPMRESISR